MINLIDIIKEDNNKKPMNEIDDNVDLSQVKYYIENQFTTAIRSIKRANEMSEYLKPETVNILEAVENMLTKALDLEKEKPQTT